MKAALLNVLNVGQGLCSVVSGIKDNGDPYCGIFDCGTLAYNPQHNKDDLLAQIRNLTSLSGRKVLTDIVISHQDIDHWSLLMDILMDYFEMKDGILYRKNKFVCEMAGDGIRLFTISELFSVNVHFEGVFEGSNYIQKLDYAIRENGDVRSLHYEGTFYEVGKNWQITVSFNHSLLHREKVYVKAEFECQNNDGKKIAVADLKETVGEMDMEGCLELAEAVLDYPINKLQYELGRKDIIYLKGHLRAILGLIQDNLHSFSDIAGYITSVSKDAPVEPIENLIWGGAEPGPRCKLAQKIMEVMQQQGLIESFSSYPDGGYIKIEGDQLVRTEAMACTSYDSDMVDAHGETIQQLNIMRNVTSAVTCMDIAGQVRFLFPGDLTVHRFDLLVETIGDKGPYMTSIMTAPHHGSDVTNFCILESNLDTRPLQCLLSLFQNDLRRVFVISALASKFGHPGINFLDTSIDHASGAAEHNVCYGLDNLLRVEKLTEAEVYCTEMTQDFQYLYPEGQNAVCDRRMQAPQMKCKAPSKRLFI